MPRSSKHKYHKRSKHSSKDYSDSEDDVVKTKDKSVRDEGSSRVRHDSTSGEKRKVSSHSRDHGNGEFSEEYVSSKRRKEMLDVVDRWSGGENERPDDDRNFEKEVCVEESLKDISRSKESSDKGGSLRIESKSKSKKYESGYVSERKEESLTSVLLDKKEGSGKWDSMRKHEKVSLAGKEEESKEKHRRSDREKDGGGESKNHEIEVKLVDSDYGKEHDSQSGDFGEEKQGKRPREKTERTMMDDFRSPDSDYELDKRSRKRREASADRDKYYDDPKHAEDRRLSSKSDRVKDVKHRDDKQKDGGYPNKYRGDRDDKKRDEKNREEADKYYYYYDDDKHQRGGEKDYKRRDDKHREDIKKSSRHKDGKRREDEHGGSQKKDDKYQEAFERDNKYHDDGHRDSKRKEGRRDEDDDKEIRHRDHGYGDSGHRDFRQREEKYHEDIERDNRQHDGKKMDDFDKEKRHRDTKYRDEYVSQDRVGDKSEQKRYRDESRKSIQYDGSPNHDDPTRYRTNENENESRSRGSKDHKSDVEKRSTGVSRPELVADRGRSTFKSSEELSSLSRRRGSPSSSSYAPRDYYRPLNSDESKYRDYKHEDRARLDKTSSRDYVPGSEKIPPSQSLEQQLGQKDNNYLEVLSPERLIKSDIYPSPQKRTDKSPSSSMGRRNFSRQELTHKGGGSREERQQYSAKDVRVNRESGIEMPHGDEISQPDADSLSISSPFIRNSNLSGSSKPPPPQPFRVPGHGWRGVTSWPSPVANSFLPFPHASPLTFPSVPMQPFPSPPMFGAHHPSMELNPAAPFPGPGRPMGWRNQVNYQFPPLNAWDANNAVFGQQSHMYGRQDSDRSGILPTGSKRDDIEYSSKGPNRTEKIEGSYSENRRTVDEVSGDDVEVDSGAIDASLSKDFEKADAGVPILEEIRGSEAILDDEEGFFQIYLSKLDISADLAEPEIFDKCMSMMDMDRDVLSDADDVKFLYVENAVESKRAFHTLLSSELFESVDDSVYEKSISLYKRHKESSSYGEGDGKKSSLSTGLVVASAHSVGEPEKLLNPPANDEQGASDAALQTVEQHEETEQKQKIGMSSLSEEENGEYAHKTLPAESDSNNINEEESKSIDSKCGPSLVMPDVSSEAVDISRIHDNNHSPESTH